MVVVVVVVIVAVVVVVVVIVVVVIVIIRLPLRRLLQRALLSWVQAFISGATVTKFCDSP